MNPYLIYNGRILRNDKPLITADNRGFRYGDGLFETMKWVNGHIQLSKFHFERLFMGMDLFQFERPAYFTGDWITEQVKTLTVKNQHPIARIRLTLFRGNGGLYDPENHFPNCIIQSWPLEQAAPRFNENGLVIGIYPTAKKSTDVFANLKTNNFQAYLLAAMYAKQMHWNDALVLNARERICDATIANLFIVKNGKLYTPALSEGCVAGTLRRYLLEALPLAGFAVEETEITATDLELAEEVFLSNAIQGVRWVQHFGNRNYGQQLVKEVDAVVRKNLF
jgi:branched-subunit amino acid aminotransferase/4-amino-4-deoxychorismate lyase